MRHIILCLTFLTAAAPSAAIEKLDLDFDKSCSYYGEYINEAVYSFRSDQSTEETIEDILRFTGLEKNFVVKAGNVPNALAVIQDRQRLIIYNQNFLHDVVKQSGTHWAATTILAHEIGHHLNNHTLDHQGKRPERELEADRFAGFILYRMGATLEEAKSALEVGGNQKGNATHPPQSARLAALANGWVDAKDRQPTTGNTSHASEEEIARLKKQLEEQKQKYEQEKAQQQRREQDDIRDAELDELEELERREKRSSQQATQQYCCNVFNGEALCVMLQPMPNGSYCYCQMYGYPYAEGLVCSK